MQTAFQIWQDEETCFDKSRSQSRPTRSSWQSWKNAVWTFGAVQFIRRPGIDSIVTNTIFLRYKSGILNQMYFWWFVDQIALANVKKFHFIFNSANLNSQLMDDQQKKLHWNWKQKQCWRNQGGWGSDPCWMWITLWWWHWDGDGQAEFRWFKWKCEARSDQDGWWQSKCYGEVGQGSEGERVTVPCNEYGRNGWRHFGTKERFLRNQMLDHTSLEWFAHCPPSGKTLTYITL